MLVPHRGIWASSFTLTTRLSSTLINVTPIVISGNTYPIGETLTATPGTWDGIGTVTLSYQWYRDGSPIAGATGLTYVTVGADDGTTITCVETAESSLGGSTTVTSNGLLITLPTVSGYMTYKTDSAYWTASNTINSDTPFVVGGLVDIRNANDIKNIIGKWYVNGATEERSFVLEIGTQVRFRVSADGVNYTTVSAGSGGTNSNQPGWLRSDLIHVCGAYDGTNIHIIVNGELMGSTPHTGVYQSTRDITVGQVIDDTRSGTGDDHYDGELSDVFYLEGDYKEISMTIFNGLLSGNTIVGDLRSYASLPTYIQNLTGNYWQLHDGDVTDLTGTENLTLVGSAAAIQTGANFITYSNTPASYYSKRVYRTYNSNNKWPNLRSDLNNDIYSGKDINVSDPYTYYAWSGVYNFLYRSWIVLPEVPISATQVTFDVNFAASGGSYTTYNPEGLVMAADFKTVPNTKDMPDWTAQTTIIQDVSGDGVDGNYSFTIPATGREDGSPLAIGIILDTDFSNTRPTGDPFSSATRALAIVSNVQYS